jgi:AhpC/TSA family
MDLPVWQEVHAELAPLGFTVISVALDKDPEDARPWIEAARPQHPSLVDTEFTLADLYNMVNVPTTVWIDEEGRIVRPNDVGYATDTFRSLTRIDSARVLDSIRAWVRDGVSSIDAREASELQSLPTEEHQLARAEFNLARWLRAHGRDDAAERHFVRAGELAPHDFTIRRGSMPMRGIDPMGPQFAEMVRDWMVAGHSYYTPLPK